MGHMGFSEIFSWLSLHHMVVWSLLALVVLTTFVMEWRQQVRYFMLNVRYGFPWIGRVARAARKPQSTDGSYRGVTWYASERMLCADYHPYYRSLDDRCHPVFFEHCQDYLNKTGQLGRRDKGALLWLATFALVIFEAVGFAYVLAPFLARNVSANAADMLSWVIALMLSIILVSLTDKMGRQLHKNTMLKKIRIWHADARKNGRVEKLEPDTEIKIDTTHRDNDKPNYIKILNRIDAKAHPTAGWEISVITVLAIAAIAMGAYVIRSHTLDGLEAEQVSASPVVALVAESSAATPFDLPGVARNDSGNADERAASERVNAQIIAYKTAFAMLSVIFIGIQVVGILFGFFYSLAGKESARASRYIRGFNNARDFSDHYRMLRDEVASEAQARLSMLQALVGERHHISGNERAGKPRATFAQYLQEKREQESRDRVEKEVAAEREKELRLRREQARQRSEGEAAGEAVPVPTARPSVCTLEAAPASIIGDEAKAIAGLGDLTGWTDDELADIAAELDLPLERLQRRQRMQKQIAQVKRAMPSAGVKT